MLRTFACLAGALLLGACATITKGTTQLVGIDTPGVPGATCTIQTQNGPQTVVTPGQLTVSKSANALPIQCVKQCYTNGEGVIAPSAEAMTLGNVIVGGVVGVGVDVASGAINKYPDIVTVAMQPDPACHGPVPPPPRKRAPHVSATQH